MMAIQKIARRRAVRYNYSFIFTLNEIYMFLFSIIKFKKQVKNLFFTTILAGVYVTAEISTAYPAR